MCILCLLWFLLLPGLSGKVQYFLQIRFFFADADKQRFGAGSVALDAAYFRIDEAGRATRLQ